MCVCVVKNRSIFFLSQSFTIQFVTNSISGHLDKYKSLFKSVWNFAMCKLSSLKELYSVKYSFKKLYYSLWNISLLNHKEEIPNMHIVAVAIVIICGVILFEYLFYCETFQKWEW